MLEGRKKKKRNRSERRSLNIGIAVCVLILAYLVVYFCLYFFGERTAVYEVTEGKGASRFEGQYKGLILREEVVVNSPGNGYINYFVGDSNLISVGEPIYILDGSGKISERLEEAARDQSILSDENLKLINNSIHDFDTSFDLQRFSDVYSFKYKIGSQVLDLINGSVFESINNDLTALGDNTYQIISSDIAGVLQHSVDGYEWRGVDSIESADFKKSSYEKHTIQTNDLVSEGDPVYKVVTSENWKIMIQIDDPGLFNDMKYVNIEFLKDNVICDSDVEVITKSGNTYAVFSLSKYMIRYLSDRFVQIRIIDDTNEGLKIPKSSLTEKQFYSIPVEFMTQGGNSMDNGFNKQVTLDDGTESVDFVAPEIIKITDTRAYVSTDSFSNGDILVKPESGETYHVNEKENLQGAYIVSNGYSAFRPVNIIGENTSFYIIQSNVPGSIRLYEQVIRDGDGTQEGEIVNR